MIKAIDEKYCINNLVQLMPYSGLTHLIISEDEIVFLKIGNEILVNKYENHPSRFLFPYSDKIKHEDKYTQIFEYNKQYLNYRTSSMGFSIHQNYFFKDNNRALYLNESLDLSEHNLTDNEQIMDRKSIEDIFNSDNYDSMYIVDKNGIVQFAKSKKDGVVVNNKIIPSDDEIIELEREDRIGKYKIGSVMNKRIATPENEAKAKKYNTIDNIKNLQIYGPVLLSRYIDILITSKDGIINAMWFTLDFVEKDVFKLTISTIPIIELTIDDVVSYSTNHTINKTSEPYIEEESKIGEAIRKIPKLDDKVKIKKLDYYA